VGGVRNSASVISVEWQTVAVAAGVYGGWLAIVLSHEAIPWPVGVALLLAVVIARHGSLQHEVLHSHPFPKAWANEVVGSIPISLVCRSVSTDVHTSATMSARTPQTLQPTPKASS